IPRLRDINSWVLPATTGNPGVHPRATSWDDNMATDRGSGVRATAWAIRTLILRFPNPRPTTQCTGSPIGYYGARRSRAELEARGSCERSYIAMCRRADWQCRRCTQRPENGLCRLATALR